MKIFQTISIDAVKQKLTEQNIILVDVRDATAYQQSHIPKAQHLSNQNLTEFFQQADKNHPVIVYCYHGFSSESAAQYLLDEGFAEVYSMTGGFAAWLKRYPHDTEVG